MIGSLKFVNPLKRINVAYFTSQILYSITYNRIDQDIHKLNRANSRFKNNNLGLAWQILFFIKKKYSGLYKKNIIVIFLNMDLLPKMTCPARPEWLRPERQHPIIIWSYIFYAPMIPLESNFIRVV